MASEELCEFWKADRYGEGKGGCYAAGEEGNIVCLTEGELGDEPLPDCTSYPFGITADRDRERARADAAEKRVAELELHEQSVDEELFRVLWEDYGSAPDDTLAPSGLKLKRKLREWVGIDAAEEDAEQLAEAVELSRWECEEDMRDIREDDTFTCGGCEGECCKVTALAAHEALKGEK